MELTQLFYFKKIAECDTITQAAQELHISQPALSTTLKKLEDELEVCLFERKRNRLFLNPAGELFLTHVNAILERVERMKEEMQQYTKNDNVISVAFCDPGPQWFLVPQFSMTHPNIEIKASSFEESSDSVSLLLNHKSDIIVSSKKLVHPEIISAPFIKDQLLLSVPKSNPLASRKEIHLKEDGLECIQTIVAFYVGGEFFEKQQKPFFESINPQIQITLYDDYFMFNQMVRGTDALTITTRLVRHYRDDGEGRVFIVLSDPELSIHYHISYLKKSQKRLEPFVAWAELCSENFN